MNKIICYDRETGEEVKRFESAVAGAEWCKGHASNIRRCYKGKLKSAYGYVWKQEQEEHEDINICPEGELMLRIAMVQQAMEDLYEAYGKADTDDKMARARAFREVHEVENWLTIGWGNEIAFGHGEEIVAKVFDDYRHGVTPNYRTVNTFDMGSGQF